MCDNCRKEFQIIKFDASPQAINIVKLFDELGSKECLVTLKQFLDFATGKDCFKIFSSCPETFKAYFGFLKQFDHLTILRIVLKLLKLKLLKEEMATSKRGKRPIPLVQLTQSLNRVKSKLLDGSLKIILSNCSEEQKKKQEHTEGQAINFYEVDQKEDFEDDQEENIKDGIVDENGETE